MRLLVDEVGVDHVDLNFGCPVAQGDPPRRRRGAARAHRACSGAIVARRRARPPATVPVTVKLRMGVDDEHLTYLDAGRIAEDDGAAAVALHARTAEQLYSGGADWAAIAELKAARAPTSPCSATATSGRPPTRCA